MRRVVTPKPVTAIQTSIYDSVHYTPGIVCYIHRTHHAQSQSVLNIRDTRQSLCVRDCKHGAGTTPYCMDKKGVRAQARGRHCDLRSSPRGRYRDLRVGSCERHHGLRAGSCI